MVLPSTYVDVANDFCTSNGARLVEFHKTSDLLVIPKTDIHDRQTDDRSLQTLSFTCFTIHSRLNLDSC